MSGRGGDAVDGAISYIKARLHEPLDLARLARHVSYSPYHFTRLFKEKTGLAPMYYVSSLRLQKAKELLIGTNLPIRDVGLNVGQQSLGTFTTRFTERVGVSPARFRRSMASAVPQLRSLQGLADWGPPAPAGEGHAVNGSIQADVPFRGIIFIGLFPKPIPEGLPPYGTLLPRPGGFCFTGVKRGVYHLMATAVPWGTAPAEIMLPRGTLRARLKHPIVVGSPNPVPFQQLKLHPPRNDDPPILISLPLLMSRFLCPH